MEKSKVVIQVRIDELSMHKIALAIYNYKNKKSIKELAATMKDQGQLEPIIIDKGNFIISGNRRYLAALSLSWQYMDAIVVPDSQDVALQIVSHNQQRRKTPKEILNEVETVLGLLGTRQGQRTDLLKKVNGNIFGAIGQDRFERAATIMGNISASTLRRMYDVVEFERESPDHKHLGLVERIISGELPAGRAHQMMKTYLADQREKENARINRTRIRQLFGDKPFNIYNYSSEHMEDIPSKSIQTVITSPPYFRLRNYNNATEDRAELGHEDTVQEYVIRLSKHLKDVKRVLKDEGSFFLNIADTLRNGENLMVPNRLVLHLCDMMGWHVVNEIIWQKTNPMPVVSDR